MVLKSQILKSGILLRRGEKTMSTKVVSEKQLAANRANAQHSTGPRTPEGKARAAMNAIRPAIIARDLTLNDGDPAEIAREFDELRNELISQLKPKNVMARLLVDRIATCYWRLRRAVRFESRCIQRSRKHSQTPLVELSRQFIGGKQDPFDIVLPIQEDLNRLIGYETLVDRQLHRSMSHLRNLYRLDVTTAPPDRAAPAQESETQDPQ